MTPIRETIARAICFERADCDIWHDIPERSRRAYRDEADAVLRALDEAGCVVVRKEDVTPPANASPLPPTP